MIKLRSLVFACACLIACSSSSSKSEEESVATTTRQAIVKGTESDDTQNSTVLVMHYDALAAGGGAASGCSGSLLTPRLVLTARHCVSVTDESLACDSAGNPIAGGVISSDYDPAKLYVFGGKNRPDFLSGKIDPSIGQEVYTTGAKNICNNDVALILLNKPVSGANITPIRLDSPPVKDELVTIIGFGISDTTPNPPTRRQRTGVSVLSVGPADGVGPAEFEVGEGACQGDSGGPAVAASGAVIGAVSRGGNGTKNTGADGCVNGTNIMSSLSGHADIIRAAYEKAGQAPWLEGQPNPTLAAIGATCAVDTDCLSNTCSADAKTCMQECSAAGATCPSGSTCGDQNGKRVCLANATPPAPADPDDSDHGCAISSSRGVRAGARYVSDFGFGNATSYVAFAFILARFFSKKAKTRVLVKRKNPAGSKA